MIWGESGLAILLLFLYFLFLNHERILLTLIKMDFLRVVFSPVGWGGDQFDPPSYFKKNYSKININLCNC